MTALASTEAPTFPAAELDRRFYAYTLDRLVAWTIDGVAALAAYRFLIAEGHALGGIALIVATVLIVGLGFSVLLGLMGLSPGKAALGLRVVHVGSGTPIGIAPAVVRSLILGVCALPTFGLGVATLAWTAVMDSGRLRRGWHDHVTESVVVDVRPTPVEVDEVERGPRHIVNLTAMRLVPPPPDLPVLRHESGASTPEPTIIGDRQSTGVARWRVSFDTGETFLVEGLALVGRRPEPRAGETVRHLLPLPSSDMSLSKTHAQFQVAPDGVLVVMDRGSTNGSILIRQGVSRVLPAGQPSTLLGGDLVRFGDRQMTVARES